VPSIRRDSVYRWVTVGSLGLGVVVCCVSLGLAPFVGIMATDAGVNATTVTWAIVILVAPVIIGVVLTGALFWFERHRRAYAYSGPVIVLGWGVWVAFLVVQAILDVWR
jgi:hypothetical protein